MQSTPESLQEHFNKTEHNVIQQLNEPGWRCLECPECAVAWEMQFARRNGHDMANSIRTPRPGVTATSRRIAEAVDNEDWQQFRLSMKGKPTAEKLNMLENYYEVTYHDTGFVIAGISPGQEESHADCDVCIRIDNYLKALARGGQLTSPMSLDVALFWCWDLQILK